jgi:hypothetical protein
MKLMGIGAAAAAVTSQLPASSMPVPAAIPVQPLNVTEPDLPFECQVEVECNVDRGPHANPYITTRADIGVMKLSNLKRMRV